MKLNLLPTTVSKQRQAKTAWFVFVLILLASLLGAAALTLIPAGRLEASKEGISDLQQKAVNAYARSNQADDVIAKAQDVIRNASLSQAMIDHNDVYPKLYDDFKPYIPGFFRVNSMVATPSGEGVSTITLTGTLKSYQQYADLMLALMRFPGATSVSRAGYNLNDPIVPAIDLTDQAGKPRKPGDSPIPDDQLERLAYFQGQAQTSGYAGVGNFGSGTPDARGATPDESLITVIVTVARDLRVPSVTDTLRGAGGGSAAPSGFGPPAGFGAASAPSSGSSGSKRDADQ